MTRPALHVCPMLCIAVLALFPLTAHSQASEAAQIDGLKQVYLDCERRAATGDLDTGEIMSCSMVYEELKRRAFNGDFKLLKAWADAQAAAEGS